MTAATPDKSLDAIRREIDSIDDQILGLLMRRFAATARVKASKAEDGSIAASPFRPAREAKIMQRLLAQGGAAVPPDVLVRLWRVILSASTQSQAQVTLHMDAALGRDLGTRLLVGQHFCGMEVALHEGPATALATLEGRHGDLAIIATSSGWAEHFSRAGDGGPTVIGTLPVLGEGTAPQLLIFGHAEPQPSGDDETLFLSPAPGAAVPGALWQAACGGFTLSALPGFLEAGDPLLQRQPGALLAGRCPRPIKV